MKTKYNASTYLDMENKKEQIHLIRKEIMSEITQALIYYEHIKSMLNIIIRSSIFTDLKQIHDSTIISILTYNDNISLHCNKAVAIYEITNREDKTGLLVLNALTGKLRDLSSTRNHLAHSKSIFKVV